jgi:hypothetical protein
MKPTPAGQKGAWAGAAYCYRWADERAEAHHKVVLRGRYVADGADGRVEMAETRVDELMRVENRLTRSFIGYLVVLVAPFIMLFFVSDSTGSARFSASALAFLPVQIGLYVWYATSAGAAAKALGGDGWKYVVWILVAPFLALVPIPIVSMIIGVSPLSIKFLLGGQLQTAIRQESFADFHRPE